MSLTWNWVKQLYYLWKQTSPAVPAPVTSSIISDHWSRLGNSRKAVLCLLWNWHTGIHTASSVSNCYDTGVAKHFTHSWKQLLHDFHLLRLFNLSFQPLPLASRMKMSRVFSDPLSWAHSPPEWKRENEFVAVSVIYIYWAISRSTRGHFFCSALTNSMSWWKRSSQCK